MPTRSGPRAPRERQSRRTTGTLYALSRSATLAGLASADDHGRGAELLGEVERPVDLVARVRLPPDRQLLRPRRLERLEGRVERRLGSAMFLEERVELLQVVGVEHGLAQVGDRTHQDAGIGVLDRPGRLGHPATALAGRRPGLRRGGPRSTAPAGSDGGARLMCSATGAAMTASRRGSPLRVTSALWPVAIAPAGAERKSVKPRPSPGLGQRVIEVEHAGDLELGCEPAAVVGRRRGQGRLGQVDRPAPSGRRPLDPARWPTVVYRSMKPG